MKIPPGPVMVNRWHKQKQEMRKDKQQGACIHSQAGPQELRTGLPAHNSHGACGDTHSACLCAEHLQAGHRDDQTAGTAPNCECCKPTVHNRFPGASAAEKYLADYSNVNTSLSLIPYYLLVNRSKVSYLNNSKEWLVVVPYLDPLVKNQQYNVSMLLYDSNLSLESSYLQTLSRRQGQTTAWLLSAPFSDGESGCRTSTPIPVYVMTDPYAPGMHTNAFHCHNCQQVLY